MGGWLKEFTYLGCHLSLYFKITNFKYFSTLLDLHFFVTQCVCLYLVMTTTEMVAMKCFYISKFSRIAVINENFISTTLILFNIVIIAINLILRLMTKDLETSTTIHFNPPKSTSNLRTDAQKNVKR